MIRQKILERRNKSRVEGKMRIAIPSEFDGFKTFHGNISKSGLYIETKDFLGELGSKMHLEIEMPDSGEMIKLRGQIVRVTKPNQIGSPQGVAITFLRVDQKYIKMLDTYLGELFDGKGIGCRKTPRVTTHVLIEIKSGDATYEAVADNLGHGGVFLKMPSKNIEMGDKLQLAIFHPSSRRKFFVEAEVVHVRQGEFQSNPEFVEGVGVQFINLPDERRKDMAGFLKSILHYQRRTGTGEDSAEDA